MYRGRRTECEEDRRTPLGCDVTGDHSSTVLCSTAMFSGGLSRAVQLLLVLAVLPPPLSVTGCLVRACVRARGPLTT